MKSTEKLKNNGGPYVGNASVQTRSLLALCILHLVQDFFLEREREREREMRAPRDGDPPMGGSPPVRAPGMSAL